MSWGKIWMVRVRRFDLEPILGVEMRRLKEAAV